MNQCSNQPRTQPRLSRRRYMSLVGCPAEAPDTGVAGDHAMEGNQS